MKTVLITGASGGIGRLTAERMLSAGWRVAVTTRDAASFADERVTVVEADLHDPASMHDAVAAVLERLGTIDVLVNNAGYGVFGPLEGTPREEIEAQFRVNVLAAIEMIRLVLPHMRARGEGTIINVSSVGGRTASPFGSLYHAAKFAIEGLSESLRYELAPHGIRVKLIEPGHFKTGFLSRSLRKSSHAAYDRFFDNYMKWVAREDEKAPSPEPVAEAILRAANDRSPRLRYPVHGALVMALVRLIPDRMWSSLMAEGMTRVPKA
jgi:NAD(P)-dependent dehydrogenase (short-subunit alcohol dehydrogenase family)